MAVTSHRRIGISTTTGHELSGATPLFPRINVATDYVDAVVAAGAVPIMLPLVDPEGREALVASMLDGLDGLILTGGQDLEPATYGQQRRTACGPSLPHRDRFDLALHREARRRQLPVLAICRGFQVVNVAEGGTLFQDLPTERPSEIVHWQQAEPNQPTHTVKPTPGGVLATVVGSGGFPVISYHHQGIDELAPGLVVEAVAPDGLVEAFSSADGRVLGLQWHPEMSHRDDEAAQAIFADFINRSARRQ